MLTITKKIRYNLTEKVQIIRRKPCPNLSVRQFNKLIYPPYNFRCYAWVLDLHKNQRNVNARLLYFTEYKVIPSQNIITQHSPWTRSKKRNKIWERIKMFFSTKLCKECFHHTLFFIILYVCMVSVYAFKSYFPWEEKKSSDLEKRLEFFIVFYIIFLLHII